MVSFTCNACGQTVRKSKVEKHYQTECHDCNVLSCLDCGKDFYGDEYASHTSCISEAEKYQGKLYKDSNSGQPPKGEKKQRVWLEKVKEAATSSSTTNPRLAKLLDRLQEYTNIPRKMKKFQNFVKNSLNVRDQKTLDELWSMFSGIQVVSDATATTVDNEAETETSMMEISMITVDNEVEVDKIKKKKHSEIDNIPSAVGDESAATIVEDILSTTKKHKKKKHHQISDSEDAANTNQLDIQLLSDSQPPVVEDCVSKKKKKSKKKSLEQEVQCGSDEQDMVGYQGTDNGVEESINHWVSSITDNGPVKKKKKKNKNKQCDVTPDTVEVNGKLAIVKKSKSKKTEVIDQAAVIEDNEVTVVELKKKRKRKALTEDVPIKKKTKLLEVVDSETELPSVKKHKKKKTH